MPERFVRGLTCDDVSCTGSPMTLRREGFDIRWFTLAPRALTGAGIAPPNDVEGVATRCT